LKSKDRKNEFYHKHRDGIKGFDYDGNVIMDFEYVLDNFTLGMSDEDLEKSIKILFEKICENDLQSKSGRLAYRKPVTYDPLIAGGFSQIPATTIDNCVYHFEYRFSNPNNSEGHIATTNTVKPEPEPIKLPRRKDYEYNAETKQYIFKDSNGNRVMIDQETIEQFNGDIDWSVINSYYEARKRAEEERVINLTEVPYKVQLEEDEKI
jgi:hypothetical protein